MYLPPYLVLMELTATEVWSRILEHAKSMLPDHLYRSWLAKTEPILLSDDQLVISTHDGFAAEWATSKYSELLGSAAEHLFGRRLSITFREATESASGRRPISPVAPPPPPAPSYSAIGDIPGGVTASPGTVGERGPASLGTPLNDRYTFDRFVVGTSNQLAAAACIAVSESPARIYNPLFIYGGVGLGKTHLMHAIGNALLTRDGGKRVAYITSERFTNDLIASIQQGRMADFRRRYREIDLLLIDDVQFLGEKERTQEEFFHTFNALYDAQRQIVLTSDRPPKEIPGLEERLVSRFEWGLVTDIKPPDLETRVAILRKKAEDDNLVLDDEVLDFIARHCRSSVRELEGATIKLLAYSSLTRREITLDLAREALGNVLSDPTPDVERSIDGIRAHVAKRWGVTVEELNSKRRTKDITLPRQVAMYLIREILGSPLVEIGRAFGGRDHSTVIHSVQKIEEEIQKDEDLKLRVETLRTEIGG